MFCSQVRRRGFSSLTFPEVGADCGGFDFPPVEAFGALKGFAGVGGLEAGIPSSELEMLRVWAVFKSSVDPQRPASHPGQCGCAKLRRSLPYSPVLLTLLPAIKSCTRHDMQ